LVIVTVRFDEQLSTMGTRVTVTLNPQFVLVPQVSVALQFTGVVPTGKVLPLGGLHVTDGGLHPPVAVTL
jgi:hypothetical protein